MSKRHYVLLSTDGFTDIPNNSELSEERKSPLYIWGFIGGLLSVDDNVITENAYLDWRKSCNWSNLYNLKGSAKLPSPIIWGEVGDDIYITLINLGMLYRTDTSDTHTIHLHGAHIATQLDGFPETSFGIPLWRRNAKYNCLCSPPTITYYFKPQDPGTLFYHCHSVASDHIQMGMYGALIIYPSMDSLNLEGIYQHPNGSWHFNNKPLEFIPKTATNRNFAYNNPYSYYDKEYIMLLSDVDTEWHKCIEKNEMFNAINFKPDYWLINGRAFPDTLLPHPQTYDNGSSPELTQLNYNSYIHINTKDKFLLRMINIGYAAVPWHAHGHHFEIIGKDSHISPFLSLKTLTPTCNHSNISNMAFTTNISSGETYDLLIETCDNSSIYENYIINGQDYIQPLCSQIVKLYSEDKDTIYDIPTEPININDINTINYLEICSRNLPKSTACFYPQFYPIHNHNSHKVTNNGQYPGGQLTYIQVDAPLNKNADINFTKNNIKENDCFQDTIVPTDSDPKSIVKPISENKTFYKKTSYHTNDIDNTDSSINSNVAEIQIEPIISNYYLDEDKTLTDIFDNSNSLINNLDNSLNEPNMQNNLFRTESHITKEIIDVSEYNKSKSLLEILDELS